MCYNDDNKSHLYKIMSKRKSTPAPSGSAAKKQKMTPETEEMEELSLEEQRARARAWAAQVLGSVSPKSKSKSSDSVSKSTKKVGTPKAASKKRVATPPLPPSPPSPSREPKVSQMTSSQNSSASQSSSPLPKRSISKKTPISQELPQTESVYERARAREAALDSANDYNTSNTIESQARSSDREVNTKRISSKTQSSLPKVATKSSEVVPERQGNSNLSVLKLVQIVALAALSYIMFGASMAIHSLAVCMAFYVCVALYCVCYESGDGHIISILALINVLAGVAIHGWNFLKNV